MIKKNVTFNNISMISWQTVVLVEEAGIPGENHRPVASLRQILSHIIKWLWIFLILIRLEGSLLPVTELHVHRAMLRARLINLMSQLVRTQI
jgi:hypothetical protein